jgi:hypothetical protein
MARLLRQVLLFVALMAALAVALDAAFTRIHAHGRGTKAQWLMQLHGQRYDLVLIGSSRGWWNIDLARIDSACGTRSISLANNHFTPAEMVLALKAFLRNGNRTQRLLIQVDHSTLTDEQDGFSSTVYEFVPFLADTLVYDHLRSRSSEWFWLRHVPFWRYAKYDFKWGLEQAALTALGHRKDPFDAQGAYFSPSDRFYGKAGLAYAPSGHRIGPDLRALLELCRSNGIEPIAYTAPYYALAIPDSVRHAPARALAAAGLVLHDFSDSLSTRDRWFNDNKHLNRAGGERFTRMLVEEVLCPER